MNEQVAAASTAALPPERVARLRDVLAAAAEENLDEVLISHAMRDLSLVDSQGRGTALNKFLPNERKARAELEKLQKLSSQLADHIEHGMHQSAFCRLWDWPYRQELVKQLRQTAYGATSALARCPSDAPKAPTAAGGRPANVRAEAVATIAAYYYARLTGKAPTRRNDAYKDSKQAYGPFYELLKGIFQVLGIKQNPEHFARSAIERLPPRTHETE